MAARCGGSSLPPREAIRACYTAPFLLEKPGQAPELIVTSSSAITSYEPETGKSNWYFTWNWANDPLRTIAGTMKIHMELEEKIDRFKNVEACVVFQSGFAANAGTVSAILGKEDWIISDQPFPPPVGIGK